jgi:hypothetical protein
MSRTLFVYWQQLTHRREDDSERRDAPVLDLAGCFGNPAIAARHAASLMRRAEPVARLPEPR